MVTVSAPPRSRVPPLYFEFEVLRIRRPDADLAQKERRTRALDLQVAITMELHLHRATTPAFAVVLSTPWLSNPPPCTRRIGLRFEKCRVVLCPNLVGIGP